MSHQLRRDPATDQWAIVAPARGRRPGAGGPSAGGSSGAGPALVPNCPFCPGNERSTPPEVHRLADATGDWRVRVVPNLFPAVAPVDASTKPTGAPTAAPAPSVVSSGTPAVSPGSAPLFQMRPAVGAHEVIIETPDHSRHLADMDEDELAAVLGVYRARYQAVLQQPGIRYAALFRNYGRDAGTSQAHPHAQLIGLPLVPPDAQHRWDTAARYRLDTGRCLYCDLLAAERTASTRTVLDTGAFVAVCAFAPRFPYETWIVPAQHRADFRDATDGDLQALAPVLRAVLRALRDAADDPPHNLVFHGVPGDDGAFHWHMQVLPRTARQAGFEISTNMAIVSVPPEQAAAQLRDAIRG